MALVEGSDGFAAHHTYLVPDGPGKAAAEPNKAMLGACAGGAVRLSEARGPLMVCEGIETGLSLISGLVREPAIVWAALPTSWMAGLRLSAPKTQKKRIVIAPDGDTAGRKAASTLGERAHGLGSRVSILTPPEDGNSNNLLIGKAGAA